MTIKEDCLKDKDTECEKSQVLAAEECKALGDFDKIDQCILDAKEESERCKDQAERDCETQDTTIVGPQATTPPPTEDTTIVRPETPAPPPTENNATKITDHCYIIIGDNCQGNLDKEITSLASYDNCIAAQNSYNTDQKYNELIKLGVTSTISSNQKNLHLICPVPTQEEKCEIILDCKDTTKELEDALNNLSGSCQDVEKTFKNLDNTDILKKNGNLRLYNNSLEYICDKPIDTEVDSSKGGGLPIGSIIGIVSVALVLTGIGFYFHKQQKKKNKDAALPTGEAETPKHKIVFSARSPEESTGTPPPPGVSVKRRFRFNDVLVLSSARIILKQYDMGEGEQEKEDMGEGEQEKKAAEKVLLKLGDRPPEQQPISSTTTPEQEGPMGAAGGGAVDHGDKLHKLGPASPDNPVQLHKDDDDKIPDDVKKCLEEIISKLEEDLIDTTPMITPPNQELVSTILPPGKPKQKVVGQESDDSQRAARDFWGRIDREAGKGNTLEFTTTPQASPTKSSSAAVSPGMSGGHQV